jgi:hypothetical protein
MKCFKIMDFKDGKCHTLFHGIDGSKAVEMNTWIKADIVRGRDGSGKTWYTTGWHVLETLEQAKAYLRRFKHVTTKVIVEAETDGDLWRKEHSPAEGLWLASHLRITKIVWVHPEMVCPDWKAIKTASATTIADRLIGNLIEAARDYGYQAEEGFGDAVGDSRDDEDKAKAELEEFIVTLIQGAFKNGK